MAKTRQFAKKSVYRDRVVIQDDFEVIHSREASLLRVSNSTRVVETQRSPQRGRTTWSRGSEWTPEDNEELALDPDGHWYDEAVEAPIMADSSKSSGRDKKKKKYTRSKTSKRPNVYWKTHHRQTYLDELLTYEGRGDAQGQTHCSDCVARKSKEAEAPEFRCLDCFGADMVCSGCCVKRHRRLPFHRIQRWSGTHFVATSLKTLGLEIQLNHLSMHCPSPEPAPVQFRILHTNGIHEVNLYFCKCRSVPKHLQLLRRGLYPANQLVVKTCATFELLRHLHLLSLTTQASMYDFYRGLEKLTNNTGLNIPKSRYRPLQRMCLQWRHLTMLKRGGRAHDTSGAEGTKEGELAIRCPTCPWPGINLPDDWETLPNQFLYMAMIAMDANFRLKQQLVSSYSQDPGLGIGWAYMVKRETYEAYVLSKAYQGDISTCVGFAALAKANTKFSKGLRYTGVGAVSCARGEMLLPCSVGNLVKGERYPNMDFLLASIIRFYQILILLASYDIICQYIRKLFERMSGWPQELRPPSNLIIIPAVPKLHEPAHKEDHDELSFHHIVGVGLTDGECPERIWASHNALGNSTKTMGPGTRQDTLDDHFSFWNWQKYISMGNTLKRRYIDAVKLRNIQVEAHRGFTSSMPMDIIPQWEAMCEAWESERAYPRKSKCPFVSEVVSISETEVRKELAEEEKKRLLEGGVSLNETSASGFLVLGLDLEDLQRRISRQAKTGTQPHTSNQQATLAEHRNSLRSKLANWRELSTIYMPGLPQYLKEISQNDSAEHSPQNADKPEQEELWLPSHLPAERRHLICIHNLPDMEEKLRTAQCYDGLEGLRHVLRLKTRMIQFKNANIRGQKSSTRSRAIIDRVHERARALASKYRTARACKLQLSGGGEWEKVLLPLKDEDIRAYTDPTQLRRGPGRRGTVEDDAGLKESSVEVPPEEEEHEEEGMEEDEEATPVQIEGISLLPSLRTKRDGTGETRRELSWIWTTGSSTTDVDDEDLLRSEWARSRARANRAKEEVSLLQEEMGRLLDFLRWKAKWWRERTTARANVDGGLSEGLRAYALEQASLQDNLALHFRRIFRGPLEEGGNSLLGRLKETEEQAIHTTNRPQPHSNQDNDEDNDDSEDTDNDSEDNTDENDDGISEDDDDGEDE